MSKQIKFVFTREDGQTLETNAIDIPCNVVDIGTFNSEQEIIQYVIINQLPTGLYKTGISTDNSSFLISLIDVGWAYFAVLITPVALIYIIVSKEGEILDYIELWYDEIATTYDIPNVINNLNSTSTTAALSANQGRVLNEKIDAAIQAAIQNTWNGEY